MFNSPTFVKRAVMNTALYVQDTYAIGRLTAIAGIRWERVEGYLPPQEHPSSEYFPTGTVINGLNVTLNTGGVLTQYVVPDTFAEVRNAPLWKNFAPRLSLTYDLTGRGRTVAKFSAGKYLDQIGTGTPGPNPNGAVSQRYTWNDAERRPVLSEGQRDVGRLQVRRRRVRRAGQQRHDDSEPESVRHAPPPDLPQRAHCRCGPRALRGRASECDLHLPEGARHLRQRRRGAWISGTRCTRRWRSSTRAGTGSPRRPTARSPRTS